MSEEEESRLRFVVVKLLLFLGPVHSGTVEREVLSGDGCQ